MMGTEYLPGVNKSPYCLTIVTKWVLNTGTFFDAKQRKHFARSAGAG